ncbi:MAG: Hpt domain-containing protein [Oscillospiraceae bacterium]|jgi:HPt (histidine-containing phosphotransfer) domain-containing protein|nr:Hpt domain-containing protein [Oscillospiraceae bacterium]
MDASEKRLYVDEKEGLARLRNNEALYKRMLGLFLKSTDFMDLEEALDRGDLAAAGEIAHAIKGTSGNLSLPKVFELSNALMIQLRQGVKDIVLIEDYRAALHITLAIIVDKINEK